MTNSGLQSSVTLPKLINHRKPESKDTEPKAENDALDWCCQIKCFSMSGCWDFNPLWMAERVQRAQTLKPCKRPSGLRRGKLSKQCLELSIKPPTLSSSAVTSHRGWQPSVSTESQWEMKSQRVLLSVAFFTTTAVKEEQKVWNLLDQKEDKNLNQSTLSKTNLETVLIICLMSPAFCIPHSGSGGSGFINNAIGLSFTVLLWHALN